jgi:hypothetical protein
MGQQMAIPRAVIAGLPVFFGWYSRFVTVRGVLRLPEVRATTHWNSS